MNFPEIPNTLARLWRLAIDDLVACLDDPNYQLDSQIYPDHHPNPQGHKPRCTVTLKGAVMAKTLSFPKNIPSTIRFVSPQLPQDWEDALAAISALSRGNVYFASNCLRSRPKTMRLTRQQAAHAEHRWWQSFFDKKNAVYPSETRLFSSHPDRDASIPRFLACAESFHRDLVQLEH